jgi:hypothetical protein
MKLAPIVSLLVAAFALLATPALADTYLVLVNGTPNPIKVSDNHSANGGDSVAPYAGRWTTLNASVTPASGTPLTIQDMHQSCSGGWDIRAVGATQAPDFCLPLGFGEVGCISAVVKPAPTGQGLYVAFDKIALTNCSNAWVQANADQIFTWSGGPPKTVPQPPNPNGQNPLGVQVTSRAAPANTYLLSRGDQLVNEVPSKTGPQNQDEIGNKWLFAPSNRGYQIRTYTNKYLYTAKGALHLGAVPGGMAGILGSTWHVQPSGVPNVYHIRNGLNGLYLAVEGGKVSVSKGSPALLGTTTARWLLNGFNPPPPPPPLTQWTYRQCVHNVVGSGIVADVQWFYPANVTYDPETQALSTNGNPVQEDKIPVFQESCILKSDGPMTAVVHVQDGQIAEASVGIGAGVLLGIGGAVVCIGTAGSGCPAVAATVVAVATGATSIAVLKLPAVADVFSVSTPGKLNVSGTAFNPSATETDPTFSHP